MRNLLFGFVLFLYSMNLIAQDAQLYFTSQPTISRDEKTIVFCYQNDIWQVNVNGGNAYRLTAMDGIESSPKFSPDGKWIAFSGTQEGNSNVYLLPVKGGDIKQLTYHESADLVESWSPDSQTIYFKSTRYNNVSIYSVSIYGGTPKRLFKNYFNTPHNFVVNPKTGDYIFNESWESNIFTHRKKYKGAYNPDLKWYNPKTKAYKQLTKYNGKDLWASFDRNGKLYFASDRANEEYNIFAWNNGNIEQLTDFKLGIKKPVVSYEGNLIVFEKDYQLYSFDIKNKTSKKIEINTQSNNSLFIDNKFKVGGHITHFDVSPDNKKIVFVSRGELFICDIEGKFVKKITTIDNERVYEAYWLKDNKSVLYSQSIKGYANWFKYDAKAGKTDKQITNSNNKCHNLSFNSDRTKAVFVCGRDEICLLDLKNFKSSVIIKDEIWGYRTDTPRFSPDDKYISYTGVTNFESDIKIYDIAKKTTINLTNTGVSERGSYWSPDGKYIYFSVDRYHPGYPRGPQNSSIYRIALTKFAKESRSENFNKLFEEVKKNDDEKATDKKNNSKAPKTKKKKIEVIIDLDRIDQRWERVHESEGQQYNPYVVVDNKTTHVLFTSAHIKGKNELWNITYKPFEKLKSEFIKDITPQCICSVKDKHYILSKRTICKLNINSKKADKIAIDYSFSRALKGEFNQMFYEAWAVIEENFYDETFRGYDWEGLRNRYGNYLSYVSTREDLRVLLNDLLGELNSSHMGFSTRGDEEKTFYKKYTFGVGLIFNNDNPYVVDKIIKLSNLDLTKKKILPGDEIVAIDGVAIDKSQNRNKYFSLSEDKTEMSITIHRGNKDMDVVLYKQSSGQIKKQLYDEWIMKNQKFVDDMSDKRIAYIHMKNMGKQSLDKFIIEMNSEAQQRDALILDLRYNTGGNVHDEVLNMLSRKPYLNWKYRGGKLSSQPNFPVSQKPIVLLINEQTLSDAEMTSAGFKELGLGKLIGTETYRWIIFTTGTRLVDGSFVRLPAWGCYTLDGKDLELNGVSPDIYVKNTFKNRLEGNDPQLKRAINEILKDLNKNTVLLE